VTDRDEEADRHTDKQADIVTAEVSDTYTQYKILSDNIIHRHSRYRDSGIPRWFVCDDVYKTLQRKLVDY